MQRYSSLNKSGHTFVFHISFDDPRLWGSCFLVGGGGGGGDYTPHDP